MEIPQIKHYVEAIYNIQLKVFTKYVWWKHTPLVDVENY